MRGPSAVWNAPRCFETTCWILKGTAGSRFGKTLRPVWNDPKCLESTRILKGPAGSRFGMTLRPVWNDSKTGSGWVGPGCGAGTARCARILVSGKAPTAHHINAPTSCHGQLPRKALGGGGWLFEAHPQNFSVRISFRNNPPAITFWKDPSHFGAILDQFWNDLAQFWNAPSAIAHSFSKF